jgi:hypothetical protein
VETIEKVYARERLKSREKFREPYGFKPSSPPKHVFPGAYDGLFTPIRPIGPSECLARDAVPPHPEPRVSQCGPCMGAMCPQGCICPRESCPPPWQSWRVIWGGVSRVGVSVRVSWAWVGGRCLSFLQCHLSWAAARLLVPPAKEL